jgi:hypothetical protein
MLAPPDGPRPGHPPSTIQPTSSDRWGEHEQAVVIF